MIELFFFMIGALVGALVAWLWLEKKATEKAQIPLLEKEKQYNELQARKFELEASLKVFKQQFEENENRMRDAFGKLSIDAIKSNNEIFMRHAEQTFAKYIQQAQTDFSQHHKSFQQSLTPLNESLQKNEQLIKSVQEKSTETFGSLQNYLTELQKSQQNLQKETGALVNALRSPKVRGRWGEIGLRRIVEFSGMSPFCDFDEQVHTHTEQGMLRPDMIIRLPENKNIVVDSKLPLSAYLEAMETDDEQLKGQHLHQHANALEKHMKQLASKAYWQQFNDSIDFVVLYVELEPAFGAALMQSPSLVLDGIKNRVVFATPTTLITLLQTIAYTWKQHKATENVMQILTESKELYQRMLTFSDYYQRIGASISNLNKTYNQSVGSWDGRVMPAMRRLEEMGLKNEKNTVAQPDMLDDNIRKLK